MADLGKDAKLGRSGPHASGWLHGDVWVSVARAHQITRLTTGECVWQPPARADRCR
jgi:hypothetical protein